MAETRIKALVVKHRQWFNSKIEETLARAWQEWSAQAAELQVLRTDAKNQRKEGRGFYKMDENNIQLLREDLTKDFHALAKSHTAAIEQLLEDFNDDQMLFHIDVEAYEEDRLATKNQTSTANRAPTTDETERASATTYTTEAR